MLGALRGAAHTGSEAASSDGAAASHAANTLLPDEPEPMCSVSVSAQGEARACESKGGLGGLAGLPSGGLSPLCDRLVFKPSLVQAPILRSKLRDAGMRCSSSSRVKSDRAVDGTRCTSEGGIGGSPKHLWATLLPGRGIPSTSLPQQAV